MHIGDILRELKYRFSQIIVHINSNRFGVNILRGFSTNKFQI